VGGAGAGGGAAATADLFSGEVKITADKTTNSLVVIASASDYRNLVKVIEKLDIPRREVLVEAVIMEVNLDNELDLGVSGHGGTVLNDVSFQGAKGQAPLVVGSELGGLNSLGGVASLGSLGGFLAGLQGPPITVPGLNISLPSFAILLNALQSSSDVNVISTPHVTMVDNTEGEITVGQNVPFQAGFAPQLTGLVGRVDYRQGSALDLPFEDMSFDVVWSQNVAMNIADRDRLYAEMHRVLKPGGKLGLQEVAAGPGGPPHYPVQWARTPSISFLYSQQATRASLEMAGFRVLVWQDTTAAALASAVARAGSAVGPPPVLGTHLILGGDWQAMFRNAARNLEERRTELFNAVLERGD